MPLSCLKQASRQRPDSPSNPFPFINSKSLLYDPLRSPHVHFPPSPSLTSVQLTHSPTSYDRRAIVVDTNNVCALPARFDRYYDICSPTQQDGGLLLRRVEEPTTVTGYFDLDESTTHPPLLMPDLSSESSDDSLLSSPPEPPYPSYPSSPSPSPPRMFPHHHRASPTFYYPNHPPIPNRESPEEMGNALSFLPYPFHVKDPLPPTPSKRKLMPRSRRSGGASSSKGSGMSVTSSSFDESELDGCLGGF
jgi:hypothetical protein